MRFHGLSPEERVEVDALVHDSYVDSDGEVRSHAEALGIFEGHLESAVQAHREWAEILLDDWRHEGMRAFVKARYKHADIFEFIRNGRTKRRTLRRGRKRIEDDGRKVDIQEPLPFWTIEVLHSAIRAEQAAISERQINIAMYRELIDLLEQTGAYTVQEGLDARGTTLQDYLSERLAA